LNASPGDSTPLPAQPYSGFSAEPALSLPEPKTGDPSLPSPRRANAALVALAAAAFLFVTNEIAPLGLIREIAPSLGKSESEVGLIAAIFSATVMIAAIPLAIATTRLPRRPLLVATLAVFSVGVFVEATAFSFSQLLVGRVITGITHALFWAVVVPTAAGMFKREVRGRSVTRLMLGASVAGVFGLPAATRLGQQTEWRVPFMAVAIGAAIVAVLVALVMPPLRAGEGSASRGEAPSPRRFARIVTVTALTTTAMACTWTYIAPFFVRVSGFQDSAIPTLLLIAGAAGLLGMWGVGFVLDRWPVKSVVVSLGTLAALWAMYATLGQFMVVAVGGLILQGVGWSIFVAAIVTWALRHSPWSTDIGNSVYASSFNLGNTVGALLGAWVLSTIGASWLPVVSLVATSVALVLVMGVRPLHARRYPPVDAEHELSTTSVDLHTPEP
jgi:predicted MFS family arabinose efflux permease